jgi:hypothetical protein
VGSSLDSVDAGLPSGVVGCFTTRSGGVSPAPWESLNLGPNVGDDPARVAANANLVAAHLGAAGLNLPRQIHGADVLVLDSADSGTHLHTKGDGVDALVTATPGIAVGVLVADCLPVLFADPANGIVAAAHAGRRGLAAGVLQATLDAMVGLGADPATTHVVIGPAICGRCYEVPAQLRDEVDVVVPGAATQTTSGTPGLDLPAGAIGLLAAAGVTNVADSGICTAEDERFFSYRRDGVTGRLVGVIMLDVDEHR